MRTTAKPVIDKIRQHILEAFEEEQEYQAAHNHLGISREQLLKLQIDHMRYNNRSTYQTALDYVEGGSLLIYHTDVQEFLKGLDINPMGKQYDDDKAWKLYCHLCAREMTKLYERGE